MANTIKRKALSRVLGAVDLRPGSVRVAEYAVRWAWAFSGDATLVHVISSDGASAIQEPQSQLERLATEATTASSGATPSIRTLVVPGDAASAIPLIAHSENCDLIVLGRSEKPKTDRRKLGAVAEAILSHPPCPVLIIGMGEGRNPAARPRRILMATDYSDNAEAAVAVTRTVAQAISASILVAHAVEPESLPGQREYDRHAHEIDWLRSERASQLHRWAAERFPAFHGLETRVVEGTPQRALCRLAVRLGVDLMVLATRGRSRLLNLLVGSTALHIASEAPCPVLLVPPPPES